MRACFSSVVLITATVGHADTRALELSFHVPAIAFDIIEYAKLEGPT